MRRNKILCPILILLIWLTTYIISQIFDIRKIEWDEAKYLACARGIVENLDFSSRSTTVLGLIKYGFPHYTHHFPLHSLYIALFFKLFGISLGVAYFATWFSVLITCLFIYLILLLVTNNGLFSFFLAVSFLYLPRLTLYCNSAMMEMPGCTLLSILIFFVFKEISKGRVNPFILGLVALFLYLYKSLFVGIMLGFIFLIVFLTKHKNLESGREIRSLSGFLIYIGTILVTYFILTKFVFLPLAPWFNVLPKHEVIDGTYADFASGFFSNPLANAVANLKDFCSTLLQGYFPNVPFVFSKELIEGYLVIYPTWLELGLFFLTLFYLVIFLLVFWKRLLPLQRTFILFTIVSILSFNLIISTMTKIILGQLSRYNMSYFPLLLISSSILIRLKLDSFKEGYKVFAFLIVSLLFIVYLPLFNTSLKLTNMKKSLMHQAAFNNYTSIKKFLGNSIPKFIYFDRGTHTTWFSYPIREIFMEASNDQIKKINSLLPQPIEYLFLKPDNYLFKENQELILKRKSIIDNQYNFYGVDLEDKIVVYKLNHNLF